MSYIVLSFSRNGINFVDITTVDNEIVAAEKQIGEIKKEVPEIQLNQMQSLKVKKEKWFSLLRSHETFFVKQTRVAPHCVITQDTPRRVITQDTLH